MGITHTELDVTNMMRGITTRVRFLVDTGAMVSCIPDGLARQLGFDPEECSTRLVTVADGRSFEAPVVRPLLFRWDANRDCAGDALVLGREPLLGVTILEALDLIVDPASNLVRTPPDRPNFPMYPVY